MIVDEVICPVTRTTHPGWLHRPTILPDELAHSYALRVLMLNAAASLDSLIVDVATDGVINPKVTKLEFLAWVAEIDVSEFVRFHTLVPFQQAFSIDANPRVHGVKRDSHLRYKALRIKEPFFRLCAACKQEDLGFWGFPIMRVSHHIPGVEYCEKHERQLISTGFDTKRISHIQKFSWTHTPLEATADIYPRNEVIQRYAAISNALLARFESIPVKHVSHLIASRSKQLGLRRGRYGTRKILSDLVLEKVSKDWLDRLLPYVLSQKTSAGVFSESFDQVMNPGVTCRQEAYVLALAVLYSDADEALSELTELHKSSDSIVTRTKQSGHSASITTQPLSAVEFAQAYFNSNFSIAAMAKIQGQSKARLRYLLTRFNLPPVRLISKEHNRTALLLFKAGAGIELACSSAGAAVSDLVQLLRFDLDLIVPLIRRR